jgi:hypothetical protein
MSSNDALMLAGLVLFAFFFVAPETVANHSRERWSRIDFSHWYWRKYKWMPALIMKPWYPTFIRFYGLAGLAGVLSYLVFGRF